MLKKCFLAISFALSGLVSMASCAQSGYYPPPPEPRIVPVPVPAAPAMREEELIRIGRAACRADYERLCFSRGGPKVCFEMHRRFLSPECVRYIRFRRDETYPYF